MYFTTYLQPYIYIYIYIYLYSFIDTVIYNPLRGEAAGPRPLWPSSIATVPCWSDTTARSPASSAGRSDHDFFWNILGLIWDSYNIYNYIYILELRDYMELVIFI